MIRVPPAKGCAPVPAVGPSPCGSAERTGVTAETARWRLKRVFAKTGTGQAAELSRLILGGAAV